VSRFLTDLDVREVNEVGGLWKLLAPLDYESDLLGKTVVVPADFVTDFASVPRLPFVYLTQGGKGNKAAVVHDWLYSTQAVDRKTADQVLREALAASGYSGFTAWLFYAAVRVGGGSHWDAPNVGQEPAVAALMQTEAP
jgi:hypothetical protein